VSASEIHTGVSSVHHVRLLVYLLYAIASNRSQARQFIMSSKSPRRSLDDLDSQTFFSVAGKLHNVSSLASLSTTDVLRTPGLSEEEISAYLLVKFGAKRFHILQSAVLKVTKVYRTHRSPVIRERYPQLSDITAEDLPNAILLAGKLVSTDESTEVFNCFGPPTNSCMDCGRELQLHYKPTEDMFLRLCIVQLLALARLHCIFYVHA